MPRYLLRNCVMALACAGTLVGCGGAIVDMPDAPPPEPSACSAPLGLRLTDTQSLVNWINAMPHPLTLPCFVRSLPRPLYAYSTASAESAQPSIGDNNPRVFVFFDKLTLSIVPGERFSTLPSGEPSTANPDKHNLLEVSYNTQGVKSTKGEIKFPIVAPLPDSGPYENLAFRDTTSICSFCHRGEAKYGEINGVPIYESDRLKPLDPIGFKPMRTDYEACATLPESYHCNMLQAIFDPGEIRWQEFPENLPNIFYY